MCLLARNPTSYVSSLTLCDETNVRDCVSYNACHTYVFACMCRFHNRWRFWACVLVVWKVKYFWARSVAILRPGALMFCYELWISFNLNQFKPCGLHEAEELCCKSFSWNVTGPLIVMIWMVHDGAHVLNSCKNVLPKAHCMYLYSNMLFIVNAFVPFDGHCQWLERQGFESLRRHAAAWPLQIPSLISSCFGSTNSIQLYNFYFGYCKSL